MENTSPDELARELLENCLAGRAVREEALTLLASQAASDTSAIAAAASRALFRGLVEPLADRFDTALCDAYVSVFSRVIERVRPGWKASAARARYHRIRQPRHYTDLPRHPERVFVLSRVTLGADVAITSVVLDAAKKRFPEAEIYFVGGRKGWELFEADPRIRHLPLVYGRAGTLGQRIEAGELLAETLRKLPGLVVDPDSRLTQLGLVPVCDEDSYFFFESRAYGGGAESLTRLAQRWAAETFGVVDAMPFIAPAGLAEPGSPRSIAISFGVGENLAKRVPDPFEANLLQELTGRGYSILIDRGAGGEESERVERAVASLGDRGRQVTTFSGSFASFAARIARSRLYIGYDSAGQHVAATCGVPLVTVFAGFTSERMFARWHPTGPGPAVVLRVDVPVADDVLKATLEAATELLRRSAITP